MGLSISFDDVSRIRFGLAEYARIISENSVVLLSHFNPKKFITAAMDNFDHNEATMSGLNLTHDTMIVMFQDEVENYDKKKPKVSEILPESRARSFSGLLPCQEVLPFEKLSSVINFADNTIFSDQNINLTAEQYQRDLQKDDFLYYLSRLSITKDEKIAAENEKQFVSSWSAFNSVITKDDRSRQIVGFLPVVPFPVTDYATVHTRLCNLLKLLDQLDQDALPIACDEGVYRIARHIILNNPEKFKGLSLFLGNFHNIKVVLSCMGKYMENSGVANIFIEAGLFGVTVTDKVLSGQHYARSVQGYNWLAGALRKLQLLELKTKERLKKYEQRIESILLLKENFQTNELDEGLALINQFRKNCSELMSDFHSFIYSRCKKSEMFKYWNNFLLLSSLMNDSIRADRTGDWKLHCECLKKTLPLYHVFDRTNYAKYGSLYFEDAMMLPINYPQVYEHFLKGRATVKKSNTPFTSVATDQALEQTVNRSAKATAGIVGKTQNKEAVTIWNITFHELLAITNFLKQILFIKNSNEELKVHHDHSPTATENSEAAVVNILKHLKENNINPFVPGTHELQNIITQEILNSEGATDLLNNFDIGIERYTIFRKERFLEKSVPFSSTVSRYNLLSFKNIPSDSKEKEEGKENKTKYQNLSMRSIALANVYLITMVFAKKKVIKVL